MLFFFFFLQNGYDRKGDCGVVMTDGYRNVVCGGEVGLIVRLLCCCFDSGGGGGGWWAVSG